nr:putative disease resistance rpp13-like protein 1 [Quercus suber]
MAGSPVKAAIQELLYSLLSLNFFRTNKFRIGLLEDLRIVLQYLTVMVDEAEEKQNKNPVVKLWLDELQDVVYHTEDLVDEMCTESLRHKLDAESQTKSSSLEWNIKVIKKMEEVLDRLEFFMEQGDVLGLKGLGIISDPQKCFSMPITSFFLVDDHEVFCRDADKDAIISLLLSDDVKSEQLSVIPIVGEVGVGKSTLARLVYNDCRVSQHFEIKAWYPVNHEMTKAVSESFSLQSLQESLKGKSFLLVLDDVGSFNYADWESLQSTLKGVASGSCVIVTTRDSEVASKISTVCTYHIESLSNEQSWLMFTKFALGDQMPSSCSEVETIGRQIVQDFLGLPFAVKALGLLLRSKPQVEEWRVVLDRLKHFSLPRGMSGDGIELRKRYDELPAQLEDNNLSHISVSTLYLSLCRGKYDSSVIFKSIDKAKFLRTFLPLDHESCRLSSNELQNMLCKLQFLRVLSLSHYHITELPASIGNLKHLRYIDLSHTGIKWLPESVCALCNLQTFILSNCHSLTKLPENMWRLVNLCHLDISGTDIDEMPKNLSRLKKLQTLPYFVVGKRSGSMLKELGGLRDLHGTLHISKLQNVVSENDPAGARLFTKKYLDELVLEWSNNTVGQENVLEALQPNSKLKKLSINFYCGTRFPNWVGHMLFSGMVSLRLSNCNNCSSLPPLGQLPSLEVLIIEWMDAVKSVGPEFCGMNKPFKSLKTLTFEGMLEWEEWVSFEVGSGEFPSLIELCIRRCPKLKGNLPKQLPSVVKVEISESQELVTTIMTEASLHKRTLHYQDKVLFISEDKVASFLEQMTIFTYKGATESSLPMTTPNIRDEADVPTNNWSNQGRRQGLLSFKSVKVSGISQLMGVTGLDSLKIEGCDALEFIPVEVMTRNPFLQHLYIINCCSLKSFPGGHPLTALKMLYIQNCKKLEFQLSAKSTHQFALLEHLCIGSSCDSLIFLPLDFFLELRFLSIWDCANLQSLSMPEGIEKDLTYLEALEIRDCPNLSSFPKGGLRAPNLTTIWFSNCKNLKELPDQFHSLNSLHSMFINNCPQLVSLSGGGLPSKLSVLCITFCDKLMLGREWGLHRLDCLSRLEIEGGCENIVSFPEEELLPSNLNSLRISELLNLEYLNYKGLQHLTALKTLEISCCNRLKSLPEEGLPSSLSFFCINECSLLKPKLQNKRKRFVSFIEADEEVIS